MRVPALLSLIAACTPDQQVVRQRTEDVFYQSPTDQVDILWVVDDSASMADEQAGIAARFEDFTLSLVDSELDFRLGIVTTDLDSVDRRGKMVGDPPFLTSEDEDYLGAFQERVAVGVLGADREKGIDAAFQALSEPLVSGANGGFLRQGANLSIIYVSDENDCSDRGALDAYDASACYEHPEGLLPVRELISDYRSLKSHDERILVSAIVGPEIQENCDGAHHGLRYLSMAQAFGGLEASICQADFGVVMGELGMQASGVMTAFQLSYGAVEDTIEVYVDEVLVPPAEVDGWTYDPTYWMLHFHDSAVPARGSEIHVQYEIASGGSLPDSGV